MGNYILNEAGEPVPEPDILRWGRWMENTDNRRVARDEVGEAEVSTVFLGIDHCWGGKRGPILFETMIFGGPHDDHQERYATRQEALDRHNQIVANLQAGKEP